MNRLELLKKTLLNAPVITSNNFIVNGQKLKTADGNYYTFIYLTKEE